MSDPRKTSAPPEIKRRSFLKKLWIALAALAGIEVIAVIVSFLGVNRNHDSDKSESDIIMAGAVDSFEPESVTAFIRGRFYLCRLKTGEFLALSRKCTHLGCTVPWSADKNQFICPCHASTFDIRGEVQGPPAPRPLDYYPVAIENSIVKVDISRPIRRNAYQPAQAVLPEVI